MGNQENETVRDGIDPIPNDQGPRDERLCAPEGDGSSGEAEGLHRSGAQEPRPGEVPGSDLRGPEEVRGPEQSQSGAAVGEPPRRPRGRPKGSKDKKPRKRRKRVRINTRKQVPRQPQFVPVTVGDVTQEKAIVPNELNRLPRPWNMPTTEQALDGMPPITLDYKPHPKQLVFAKAIEKLMGLPQKGTRTVLFLAGVRSGKTWAGSYEAAKQIYIYQKPQNPNLGYIVSPTVKMGRVPRRMFEQACGKAILRYRRAGVDGPPTFYMVPSPAIPDHEYLVEMHSADHPDALRGASVSWALLDEALAMKPEVYDIIRARLVENDGICIITTSPPHYPSHWLKTEVYDRAYRCGICHRCVYDHEGQGHEPAECYGNPLVAVVCCSVFDNTYQSKEALEELQRVYALKDPVIVRRELYGEFAGFSGVVYSAFDKKTHLSPYSPANPPPGDSLWVGGLDFGVNDPYVAVFLCKCGDTWHVVDEYYYKGPPRSTQEHFAEISRRPFYSKIIRWWYDPSARQSATDLTRLGMKNVYPARHRRDRAKLWNFWRIELVTSWLRAVNADGRPKLQVSPHCVGTISDFESRRWKRVVSVGEDGKSRVVDNRGREVDRGAGEEILPGNDHATDAIEYVFASEEIMAKYEPKNRFVLDPLGGLVKACRDRVVSPLEQYLAGSLAEKYTKMMRRRAGRVVRGWYP